MNLSAMKQSLHKERERLFKSTQQSDRGRFYIVNQLITVLDSFNSRGYDAHKIHALLATLAKIAITDSKRLHDIVEHQIEHNGQALFKLPVFPITMDRQNYSNDLLYNLYHELHEAGDEWRFAFSKEAIDNFEILHKWEESLLKQSFDESAKGKFDPAIVHLSGRGLDSKHDSQAEARIQEYVSRANLEQDAKLAAYHFIRRAGGSMMTDLLSDIFNSEFKNIADWSTQYNRKIDWTYDDNKRPICKTAFGVDLNTDKDEKQSSAHHDPRIFAMQIDEEKESDLMISSTAGLKWDSQVIVPEVSDIILSGKHSNLMPLLYRFA